MVQLTILAVPATLTPLARLKSAFSTRTVAAACTLRLWSVLDTSST
jgi:hypothetical protein